VKTLIIIALALGACGQAPRNPASPHASRHVAAGVAALEAGELDRAEAEFHVALDYEPRMTQALNGLGLVHLAREDYDEARRWFFAAVRVNEEFAEGHANLGAVEIARGETRAALPHLMRALAIDPGYVPARHNLARSLHALGRYDEARQEYMKLTSIAPDRADGWAELAVVELARGDHAAAGRAADRALALDGEHRLARRVRADLLRDAGDLRGALAAYEQLGDDDADALVGRGLTLMLMGRPAEARPLLERAVELAPALPAAHFALGVAYVELERYADAEVALGRAIELANRAYPEARYVRAHALASLDRRADAIAEYRAFLREAEGNASLADAVKDAKVQIAALERQ
jgi:tetratricopeptide (TPR) repeat protein